jgi:O-antigen biosynthesis protein WbqP
VKRLFDLVCSVVGLMLLLPLFIAISFIIKVTDPGPIFFSQRRMGANNIEFIILKFRTMKVNTPNVATHLLENPYQYITKIGRFLRKTSLDELPQIINVLTGKMSCVGPRPALYNQDDLIGLRTSEGVHKLKPGITGWAQINGRDELSIVEKVKLDKEYLKRKNLFFDIKIIFLTFTKVFKSDGVSEGKKAA